MTRPLSLLLVDDNPDDRALVIRELHKALPDARIDEIADAAALDALLADGREWDVAVTDYQLCWSTGMDVFRRLQAERPGLPVILFTASGDGELAATALKQGMDDYITKTPRHYGRVPFAVQASAERRHRRREAAAARAALERSEMMLKLALESVGMETWDYDLAQRRLVLHGRSSWLPGVGTRELTADALFEAVHPDDGERLQAGLRDAAAHARRFEDEFRVHVGDELRWVRVAGAPARAGCMAGVFEDITRRKRDEEALRAADHQKDQFIATLGHELRNPLTPIRYAAQLLGDGSDARRTRQARATIERQADAMASLLDRLLDLSHVARDRIDLLRAVLDLRDIVSAAFDDARLLGDATGHALSLSQPERPVHVEGDALRLKQVADHLLRNALRYTPAGGRIGIVLSHDGDAAVLRVHDNGIGLEPEMQDRVFEPLVQARAGPDAPMPGGLGIGLSLVRRLVELHGGSVAATSPGLGGGTTFEVRLPQLADACLPAAPARSTPPRADRPLRILVTDDQPDAARSLGMLLELHGHEVRAVLDGLEAQSVAQRWQPDVMLLDIGMPGAHGDDVARWVRQQPWGSRVRLVAITGWGRDEDQARLREAGFDVHLVKPVAVDALLGALAG